MHERGIRIMDIISWLFFTLLIFLSVLLYLPLKLSAHAIRLIRKVIQ